MSGQHRAGQHRDPVAPGAAIVPRPEAGPIAVLPETSHEFADHDLFADAVRAAGGDVAPLSDATRGIVWLDSGSVAPLADALERHPEVSWVQLPWAGVDAFADVLATLAGREHPPVVTSAKGAYAQPVAEHALALALSLARELPRKARTTAWDAPKRGRSLYGASVVVVGAGGIAIELARLLEPFAVALTVVRRTDAPVPWADRTVTAAHLHEVLPEADVLILAAAATSGTARLIGADELALLPAHAVLVNVARGSLVDTEALLEALDDGALGGAGLDVTDPEPLPDGHPLFAHPLSIVTSHAADTPEMVTPLLAERIGANVRAFVGDGRFTGVVDLGAGY